MDLLSAFSNPYVLSIVILLSLVSTFFTLYGLRQKNLPGFLLGIGTGVPTFSPLDWRVWVVGGGICAIALWVHTKMNSI